MTSTPTTTDTEDIDHEWLTTLNGANSDGKEKNWFQNVFDRITSDWIQKCFESKSRKEPIIALYIPIESVDSWNAYALMIPSEEAYETNGGIDKNGKLLDIKVEWKIKPEYNMHMIKFALRHKLLYNDVLTLDKSLRTKYARRVESWVFYIDLKKQEGIALINDPIEYKKLRLGKETHVLPLIYNLGDK